MARFADGRTAVEDLPLRRMDRAWGKAGQAGLDRMEAMSDHPGHEALALRIAAIREAGRDRAPTVAEAGGVDTVAAELAAWLPVRPEGAAMPAEDLARINAYWLGEWHNWCAPQPDAVPRCVVVRGRFGADLPAEDQAMILMPDGSGGIQAQYIRWPEATVTPLYDGQDLPVDAVRRILSGEFSLVPVQIELLELDGIRIAPDRLHADRTPGAEAAPETEDAQDE